MKNSVLDFIYHNDGGLLEKVKLNEEYEKLSNEAFEYYKKLEEDLSEKNMECFHNFVDTNMYANCEKNEVFFITGFKLGLKLVFECLCDGDI